MEQIVNPYLPGGEYIPDGEPYVFGDRVYVYGSHDRFGAPMFCMNDYVCWSAPILPDAAGDAGARTSAASADRGAATADAADDARRFGAHPRIGEWRCEGVIFRKNQDPKNRLGLRLLFAPDVAVGPDGRYYLYYAFDFMGVMGVAVADDPAGPYEYYGHVHYPDGTVWGRRKGDSFPFDPGVLVDDDGRVYLYSGFYTPVPAIVTGGRRGFDGGYVLELEPDMVTIKTPERLLFPKQGPGSFPGHEFFEASSMRKYDGKYYFVYSSRLNHELCYAVSDSPTGGFVYGGTLVSNGDVGLPGAPDEVHARNYTGNTHGGMLRLGDDFYIFYHRQTNRSSYARQACAERLRWTREADGTLRFAQAEMTSCGLNGGSLDGRGEYEARIACDLWSKDGTGRYDVGNPRKDLAAHPYLTQDECDGDPDARQYVANMRDGATAGYKYFDFGPGGDATVSATVRAHRGDGVKAGAGAHGELEFRTAPSGEDGATVARIRIDADGHDWTTVRADGVLPDGVRALYVVYRGDGAADLLGFGIADRG